MVASDGNGRCCGALGGEGGSIRDAMVPAEVGALVLLNVEVKEGQVEDVEGGGQARWRPSRAVYGLRLLL